MADHKNGIYAIRNSITGERYMAKPPTSKNAGANIAENSNGVKRIAQSCRRHGVSTALMHLSLK